MKATDFIKKHGMKGLKEAIAGRKTGQIMIGNDYADAADLSRVIESIEMVQNIGGLGFAKDFIKLTGSTLDHALEKAIADVEACQL